MTAKKQLSILSFTDRGDSLSKKLSEYLSADYSVECSFQSETEKSLSERSESAFKGDGIIFIGAAGIAVRAIAPFIDKKDKDPAVIVIDEAGKHVIPILSGHIGGANRLAERISELLHAEAFITTATDINDAFAADSWAVEKGYAIENTERIKDISAAVLKGERTGISVSPYLTNIFPKTLNIIPKCLCLGVGCRKNTDYDRLKEFILGFFKDRNISFAAVSHISTIDIKRDEEAIGRFAREYNLPLKLYSADELNDLPSRFSFDSSDFVKDKTGVGNVCERAAVKNALELADPDSVEILEKKVKGDGITLALAIYDGNKKSPEVREDSAGEKSDRGIIRVTGLGPGSREQLTPEARKALESSDIIIGYKVYTELIRDMVPGRTLIPSEMRQERERCEKAREYALQGKQVAVVCSGDSGIYGMAALLHEVCSDDRDIEIEVIPGLTAAISGGALLGAPLTNDFSVISLSDHLTEWAAIERRLYAAADSDMVIVLYNPKSRMRPGNLKKAVEILLRKKDENTVCGFVKNIGRAGESAEYCSLSELPGKDIDMFTTVFIGNSDTYLINGKMITKRGYRES